MRKEEAIKALEKIEEKLTYQGIVSYSNKDKQALTSAISDLQAYEKLKERLDVDRITLLLYSQGILMNYSEDRKRVAQTIINFLKEG